MIGIEAIIKALYSGILGREIGFEELEVRLKSDSIRFAEVDYLNRLTAELVDSEEFQIKRGLNPSVYNVQPPDIYYAYKFFLGRLPEGDAIYEDKMSFKNVEQLLSVLVRSEEFIGNLILKDVISVRRKPAGFALDVMEKISVGQKNIIVLSGCQGKQIADYFQIKTGIKTVPNVYLGNKELVNFIRTQGDSYRGMLASYDLIYTQKKEVFDVLQSYAELASKVRLMPIIEHAGFQPDQVYVFNDLSQEFVIGPLGEYQSLIVVASFYAGYSEGQCKNFFCSRVYAELGYSELQRDSLECLRLIGLDMGYAMDGLIDRWNKSGKWMRTINHPYKHVLGDMVDQALMKESILIEQDIDQYVVDHLASNVDWPLYPDSLEDSDFIRFKVPSALTAKSNVARFLDLEEFIDATYRSLGGIDLSNLRFNQLGRNIDLQLTINALVRVCPKRK
ncbi:WcbI family polysaccharide biosynthesis putative acetyltransferase [Pseudomonas sp. CFBP 13602]|uniref:WcbI family polysaccharide biosynthesis putative acetyltransferase n=1 Tax=Pseudomonas sp. CFBP 13602 TaxID=2774039 RepID=UPI001783F919|nr:WcbI family polysaccharide biosynthesis putative acetyltransferase [Pseudomonas sp. CFBP 13602]MBD8825242.1 hypothetical protein [Pseudomonas sp. CFBP 13602]